MRMIEYTTKFRRDYKREKKGQHRADLDSVLRRVLSALVDDVAVPQRHRDHLLSGDWNGCRECHLKPDLLLIYQKPEPDLLVLVRLGSHSELFG